MRYLGNKTSMLEELEDVLETKGLLKKGYVFFDAFSGTASVGTYFKDKFKIIANDNLYFSYVYSHGKLNYPKKAFRKLDVNPFEYFNRENISYEGFIYNNYSLGGSERMYFSEENAGRIDYIRYTIEEWKKQQLLSDDEYYYLIGSLLESVSKVANVAGVYGSFLRIWDSRAVKTMECIPIDTTEESYSYNEVSNAKIEDIISRVEADILYLDPPYTVNQYATQYHVLETIAKYDNPEIKGVTGTRDTTSKRSDWSRRGRVEILFDQILAHTKAKHVVLSYSSKGIMSKEYIESVLKRYGDKDTLLVKEIPYKKYLNHRTNSKGDHFEYILYIKLNEERKVYYNSPLNYIGNKYNLLPFIFDNMPKNYSKFIDIFGGGFNVGINSISTKVIYNDINFKVKELLEMFRDEDTYQLKRFIESTIKRHNLEKNDKEAYTALREIYNHPEPPKRDVRLLYVLILYGFNQQIRFNSQYEFNNPVGESSYNDRILEKMISFSRRLKEKNAQFRSDDFEVFIDEIDSDTMVYLDPPYLITLGSYNDGKRGFNGWDETDEIRLLNFLDQIHKKSAKFMLSNVLIHKDEENKLLKDWLTRNKDKYKVIEYNGTSNRNRNEVIVINYEV